MKSGVSEASWVVGPVSSFLVQVSGRLLINTATALPNLGQVAKHEPQTSRLKILRAFRGSNTAVRQMGDIHAII